MPNQKAAAPNPDSILVEVALPVPLPQTFTYLWPGQASASRKPDQATPPPQPAQPLKADLVAVPFGRRREIIGLVTQVTQVTQAAETAPPGSQAPREIDGHPLRPIRRLLPPEYRLEADRWQLAEWLASYYALPLGEVVPLFHPPSPGTKYRPRARPAHQRPQKFPLSDQQGITLNKAQQEAVETALQHLHQQTFGAILVHGITGSGKTEVYLCVIAEALQQGRSAIYLLPEIALTPQTLARIHERFGAQAAAIHSGMSAGQRCAVHEGAARGEIKVVVGPRSALFAPVRDLGVIIIDEEHETSFKQEEKPRYHARHAALMRGQFARAVVLLGSATPDLESYHNARHGRYHLARLPERAVGELPDVQIVDMRGRPAPEGFSEGLLAQIDTALRSNQQIILFYNRRGFARVIQCQACGEAVQCPRCDIGLTFHLRPRRLLCHYCGHTQAVPSACPACNSEEFLPLGGGTEKVELALAGQFPGAPLLRLDQDTTRRRGSHDRILGDFAVGRARILLGTQMVAKGHHFPSVGLVGVLAADDGLTLPDFRAGERAFQLLTQVAGRTGRQRPGLVIFQTYRPDEPVILAAARHDYEAFAERELEFRRAFGYPPFRRLLRVAVSGRRLASVEAVAARMAEAFRQGLKDLDLQVLGPAPAVFARLQDRHRAQLLVKGTLPIRAKAWLATCANTLKDADRGVDIVLDFDPMGLY